MIYELYKMIFSLILAAVVYSTANANALKKLESPSELEALLTVPVEEETYHNNSYKVINFASSENQAFTKVFEEMIVLYEKIYEQI